jgi:hypothetical protein
MKFEYVGRTEHATVDDARGERLRPFLDELEQLRTRWVPCAHCRRRATTRMDKIGDVCSACAETAMLNYRVQRQRETMDTLRARRRR